MKCRRRRFCTSSIAVAVAIGSAVHAISIHNSSRVAVVYGVRERSSSGEDHIGRREHVYEYLCTYAVFNASSPSFRLDIILRSRFCKFYILQTLFIHFTGWNVLFLRCYVTVVAPPIFIQICWGSYKYNTDKIVIITT